jgi:Tfp pilus assembly protein PilX
VTARTRNEEGFALISAITIMVIVLGLGFALLSFTDNQTHAAAAEGSSEQAYALAEGALNAQIFQLSVRWPSSRSQYPSSCNAGNGAATAGCPSPTNLAAAYPTAGSSTCPASTPRDAWNSGTATTNGWTTYVRDDGVASDGTDTSQLFNSTKDVSQPTYDANGDKGVWVRAVGVVNCHMSVVLSKVAAQFSPMPLPQKAVAANGFATSNNGNKIIVDTAGTYAQPPSVATQNGNPGNISMRCTGLTTTGNSPTCASFRDGQVSPNTTTTGVTAPANSLTAAQINALRTAAEINGTYYGSDPTSGYTTSPLCPANDTMSALSGAPVFIEGPCPLQERSGGTANSSAAPGVLVINNGTLTLDGGSTFFGVIYAANAQGASGTPCGKNATDVVTLKGNSEIQGAVIVDGAGTVCFGSSGGNNGTVTNFAYDDRGFASVVGWSGAAGTPNSFRVLPAGQ